DALDKRVGTLEETVKNNAAANEKSDTDTNKKLTDLDIKVDRLSTNVETLATKIGDKAEAKDIVTPGMLNDFMKKTNEVVTGIKTAQENALKDALKDTVKGTDVSNLADGL